MHRGHHDWTAVPCSAPRKRRKRQWWRHKEGQGSSAALRFWLFCPLALPLVLLQKIQPARRLSTRPCAWQRPTGPPRLPRDHGGCAEICVCVAELIRLFCLLLARFIEFVLPYSSSCKAFAPTWQELTSNKDTLRTLYPDAPFSLAQVDCSTERDICVREGVTHVPKLSLYVLHGIQRSIRNSHADMLFSSRHQISRWDSNGSRVYGRA